MSSLIDPNMVQARYDARATGKGGLSAKKNPCCTTIATVQERPSVMMPKNRPAEAGQV